MSLTVIQKGLSRDLVVLFFPSPIGPLRSIVARAVGPTPIVVLDETARGEESLGAIGKLATAQTGRDKLSLACLGGFSAGCMRVRALTMAGAQAGAYLFVDGAHASNPPADSQIKYLQDLAAAARQRTTTLVISHTFIVTEPRFTSTAAVARLVTGWDLPMPERDGFSVRFDGNLFVYSVASGPSDAAAHSAQANVWLPVLLDGHVRPNLQPGYEPMTVPLRRGDVPGRVFTVDGWMDLEAEYVPRVVTLENGKAGSEALKAQAVAARTFVLRAMRDKPGLGTPASPIPNSETFQVYARGATPAAAAATNATTWQVATYQNELILGNYVAGALWSEAGTPVPGTDPKGTERWVTYNGRKWGDRVERTKLAAEIKANRGCMSQNGARWMAGRGYDHLGILRTFYGADVELYDLRAEAPWTAGAASSSAPAQSPGRGRADSGALVFLASVGAAWWFWNGRSI
ncbi:MAG: SpoIID/LytB domain-containing protein [Polyangiaceae bacterium]|nr:SpoIID/LytB domain-containing protein [Polyangiaceae bacterium]